MFDGHVFLVSPEASPRTVAHITQNGGGVVYDLDQCTTAITSVIIADHVNSGKAVPVPTQPETRCTRGWATANGLAASLENRVRASRTPVVYERWVHECAREARLLLPYSDFPNTVAYDPFLFAGVRFTTTQLLPLQLKANIVAVMQFYGATYHAALLDTTNLVVYSHMRLAPPSKAGASASADTETGSGAGSSSTGMNGDARSSSTTASPTPAVAPALPNPPLSKLSVARARGLPCVTPQWIQLCLTSGVLQPATTTTATATNAGAPLGGSPAPPSPTRAAAASDSAADTDSATAAAESELVDVHDEIEQWIGDVLGLAGASPGTSSPASKACCPAPEEAEEAAVSDDVHTAARLASELATKSRKRRRAR